ncbi:MAG: FtsX-like permease family protein [Luteitalea sp.]|nr:FtsX-like permease family protein [Luteitalea sp.]
MQRTENYLNVIGRAKEGLGLQRVRQDLDQLAERLAVEYPASNAGVGIAAVPYDELMTGDARKPLLLLLGAVCGVLLMAASNVAHLLLARSAARRQELTVRAALGANRWRLLRQSFAETLLLVFGGGLLGVLIAIWMLRLLEPMFPDALPRREEIAVDGVVLGFAFVATLVVGVFCGLAPAMVAWRTNLDATLKGTRHAIAGSLATRSRVVILVQVTLSVVLLVSAVLLVQSFRNVLAVDAGFAAADVKVLSVSLPGQFFVQDGEFQAGRVVEHFEQASERVGALPGVDAVGLVNHVPLGGDISGTRFTIEKRPPLGPEDVPTAGYRVVSPTYLSVMRARLVKGRFFRRSDRPDTAPVLVINESMAKRFWASQDPVGARIRRGGTDSTAPFATIVGVVADMKQDGLDQGVEPEIYIPHTQFPWPEMKLVVRTSRSLSDVAPEIRRALFALSPAPSIQAIRTLDDVIWTTVKARAFTSTLLTAFSVLALLLATLGVYAVTAYATSRRTKEIAVRVALGAHPSSILRAVMGETMRLVGFGLALGAVGAYGVARIMSSALFGISVFDGSTYAAGALVVAAVAALATWGPARQVLRVDPVVALRVE